MFQQFIFYKKGYTRKQQQLNTPTQMRKNMFSFLANVEEMNVR